MPEPLRRSWSMYTRRPAEVKYELSLYLKQSKFPSVGYFDLLRWWVTEIRNFQHLRWLRIIQPLLTNPNLRSDMMDVVYSKEIDHDIREAYLCTKHWLENPGR
ncbi:hypothetical protein Ddye_025958 [Dipteronia dyeriana]|uniref:Uncharacterized protein n=1 Tax=Dipteronia dyeriana TaxID=168575 RepID=A0AAD9WQ11_9ROSI|nr:hypothetical protein Ddye_025958 [Dipteronia dyeriana]